MADGNGQAAGAASRAGNGGLETVPQTVNIAASNTNLPGASAGGCSSSASGTAPGNGSVGGGSLSNNGFYQLSITSKFLTTFLSQLFRVLLLIPLCTFSLHS